LIEKVVPPTLPQKKTAIILASTLTTQEFAVGEIGADTFEKLPERQRATPAQITSTTKAPARMAASVLMHLRASGGYFDGQSQRGLLSV
jgi:hypothetical protein